ncbi:hypothetical protein TrLO_g11701 [Triparma laevis f. longispina]|uniref:Uncharacterized protein n=1 Tax=Triparma laevis f. longispina TaxID=1714387 RepID=A0A9W7F425_9STRA|nr:hypothetical protein TrLO_g11701 [Triparma laevis f. longispina]
MFIEKDIRKIPVILSSPPVTHLKLARRPAEFSATSLPQEKCENRLVAGKKDGGGTLKALITPEQVKQMDKLEYLSVYDSSISSLTGIGSLESTPLTTLIVGLNPIKSLPSDLSFLSKLMRFECDDAMLEYDVLPFEVCCLVNLEVLRLSGNRFKGIGEEQIEKLKKLKILNMDNNLITTIPPLPLPHLETLSLRSNKIAGSLSKDLFKTCSKTLKQLCLSSNELTSFDLVEGLKELKVVEKVYLNKNKIKSRFENTEDTDFNNILTGVGTSAGSRDVSVNLSNNPLEVDTIPQDCLSYFGEVDAFREWVGKEKRRLSVAGCGILKKEETKKRKRNFMITEGVEVLEEEVEGGGEKENAE